VLRIQPPLTISDEEVAHFLEAAEQCCSEINFSNKMIDGIIAKSGLGQHQGGQKVVEGNGVSPKVV
jgi:hypothetical protein